MKEMNQKFEELENNEYENLNLVASFLVERIANSLKSIEDDYHNTLDTEEEKIIESRERLFNEKCADIKEAFSILNIVDKNLAESLGKELFNEEVSSSSFSGMILEIIKKVVNLNESQGKSIGLTFGRFNPPTVGHINVLVKAIHDLPVDEKRVYLSHTQDRKKNPLPYKLKLDYLNRFMQESSYKDVIVQESPRSTLIDILQDVYKEGYTDVTLMIGSDRFDSMQFIKKYNGQFDEEGNGYSFNSIEFKSAGSRDRDNSDYLKSISASKLRQLALDDDFESFRIGIPTKDEKLARKLFEDLRSYM